MAEIGYGYGSEWHLMRFMARHRHHLEDAVRAAIGSTDTESFYWYDFGFGGAGIATDKELKGLSFLDNSESFKDYIKGWRTSQSWDAVFKLGDVIYLVEAKAHIAEMSNEGNNGGKSKDEIEKFIIENLAKQKISINKDHCLGKYYQLANRLATAAFLTNKGYKTKCVYIYFLNGFQKPNQIDLSVVSLDEYLNEIEKEMTDLGLNPNQVKPLLYHVFIDAKTGISLK